MTELRPFYQEGLEVGGLELRLGMPFVSTGAMDVNSLKATVGAGNTVDIAAGWGIVENNFGAFQGKYGIVNDATKNSANFEGGGIPAAGAQPAVHAIVAKVWDPAYESVATYGHTLADGRRWRLMVVPGVATTGAQIADPLAANYRAGAVSLTADPWRNVMHICDVLRATNGTITIADRRLDATGKFPFSAQSALKNSDGNNVYTIPLLATVLRDPWDVVYEAGALSQRLIIPKDGWWAFDSYWSGSSLAVGARDYELEVRVANVFNRFIPVMSIPVDTNETTLQAPLHRVTSTEYMVKGEQVLPRFRLGAGGAAPGVSVKINGRRFSD
jgi:hypothetical protein